MTGWCETTGALMATELPGIYLQRDRDLLVVFDHVAVTRDGDDSPSTTRLRTRRE